MVREGSAGRRRGWRFWLAAGAAALLSIEVASFAGVQILKLAKPDMFYRPGELSRERYARYLAERDPVLGWPRPTRGKEGGDGFDASGSRLSPAHPDPATPALVSLYGDSMTEGLEVDHQAAWGNQLARLIGGRVANFGVAGYGTDQAYLRFLHNEHDRAPIVLLNHFSDDIRRNVNQWRYLLSTSPGGELGFKPRFLVDASGSALEPVPLPALTYEELQDAFVHPERHLAHEFYVPDDGVSGVQTARFPWTLTLLRTHENMILGPKVARLPRHFEHYLPEHPSDALRVTRLVLRDFVVEANKRGRTPIVTVIPDGKDLDYFRAHGAWPYQPLIDELAGEHGIEAYDFGPGLVARLGERSHCEVINRCDDHFNAEGYRMLAELAYEHLQDRGLLPRAAETAREDDGGDGGPPQGGPGA